MTEPAKPLRDPDDRILLILDKLAARYPRPLPELPVNGYARGWRQALSAVREAWDRELRKSPVDAIVRSLKETLADPPEQRGKQERR